MNNVLLVGSGPMAVEYAKVLRAQSIDVTVVGRGAVSAAGFTEATGIPVFEGGIESWLALHKSVPAAAIVAVGEWSLGRTTLLLLDRGVKNILVEKPGGATVDEIRLVEQKTREQNALVFVAYNRRFYASVMKAQEIIKEDGGVTSFNFEFTEWSHVIKDLVKEPGVKENWFLHNSTHVVDLAFFLGGKPREFAGYVGGSLDWHPDASIYAGAGVSELDALFSYQANWEAPGRWGVEILTRKRRLILRPLEKLQIQNSGSIAIERVPVDDTLDVNYKAGLYLQIHAFLAGDASYLCTIHEQSTMVNIYNKMNASLK